MIVDPKEDVHLDRYVSEEIVLNCELSRSNGTARWFKDGLEVQETENVRVSSEGPYRRITILCGTREDSGEYVCDTGGDSVFFQLSVTGRGPASRVPLLASELFPTAFNILYHVLMFVSIAIVLSLKFTV